MLLSSHKWLRGKRARKIEKYAKDISTGEECPIYKDGKQSRGQGGLESVTDLGQKNQNYILGQTNVYKISVALIQAEKRIFKDGIYPEQRFKFHYQQCVMQPSQKDQGKIQVRELKCHRQNTEHKACRDCIGSRTAFAGMSRSFPRCGLLTEG